MAESTPKADSCVIIPMYNECENAAAIIDAVMKLAVPFDILVIDDSSPDGTAAIVKGKMKEYPGRIELIERAGKLGLGTAYITGFKHCLTRDYEFICEMDADFSHNPEDLVRLRQAASSCRSMPRSMSASSPALMCTTLQPVLSATGAVSSKRSRSTKSSSRDMRSR